MFRQPLLLLVIACLSLIFFPIASVAEESEKEEQGLPEIELSLEQAIAIALEYSLDVRIQNIAVETSERDINISRASFDPIFTTGYSMTKSRQPTVNFFTSGIMSSSVEVNPFTSQSFNAGINGILPIGTSYRLDTRVNRGDNPESSGLFAINPRHDAEIVAEITQPLLKGFGKKNNLADVWISMNNAEISKYAARKTLIDTIVSTHNAYYDLLFAIEDVRVKEEALKEAKDLLQNNKDRKRAGSATDIDIYDAEANVQTQTSGVTEAKNERKRTQDALLVLINYMEAKNIQTGADAPRQPLDYVIIPSTKLDDNLDQKNLDLEQAMAFAMGNRTEIQENLLNIHSAELELARSQNNLLPSLNLRGVWTQSGLDSNLGNSIDSVATGRFYDWTLGLTFEYPIGNRAEKNRVINQRNSLQTSRLQLQKLQNDILLEVRSAIRDIESSTQRIITNKSARYSRTEQLKGEKVRLKAGSSTSYQVLQIQNDLLEAETEVIRSLIDYQKSIIEYKRATGNVLEHFDIKLNE